MCQPLASLPEPEDLGRLCQPGHPLYCQGLSPRCSCGQVEVSRSRLESSCCCRGYTFSHSLIKLATVSGSRALSLAASWLQWPNHTTYRLYRPLPSALPFLRKQRSWIPLRACLPYPPPPLPVNLSQLPCPVGEVCVGGWVGGSRGMSESAWPRFQSQDHPLPAVRVWATSQPCPSSVWHL